MRRSLFSIVDSYPEFEDGSRDRYAELARLAEAADAVGLAGFWVAEHHFHSGGVDPAPSVLLAHLAGRTQRIRLGAMVSVLPFHPAVDLAEQYALLDRLSGGRLDLGVGSGYIPAELEGFGIPAEERRPRFDAALDTLARAWSGGELPSATPGAPSVRLNVRPAQAPSPPIWFAVQRREAIPFVAKRGANLALVPYATLNGPEELAEEVREYRAALPSGSSGRVAAALHVHIGAENGVARGALQRFLDSRRATQSAHYLAKVRADPRHASAEHLEASGLAALGTASRVEERLAAFARAGVDELLAIVDFGGIAVEEAVRTATRLADLEGF